MKPWQVNRIAENQRRARTATCPRCRATILKGPDADDVAMTARADPTPISSSEEDVHLLAGGVTYDYYNHALYARYPHNMRPPQKHDVYRSHECPRRIPSSP